MKVVHVLRKPCSEGTVAANVLKYGTGALNIDATRIGWKSSADAAAAAAAATGFANSRARGTVTQSVSIGKESRGAENTYHPEAITGRWPANLVLQHLPTCEQTGTREEPGYTVNRFTDGAKPFGGGAGHPYESEQVPPSTVPVWACGAGCPVAGLDAQSEGSGASRYFKQVGGTVSGEE